MRQKREEEARRRRDKAWEVLRSQRSEVTAKDVARVAARVEEAARRDERAGAKDLAFEEASETARVQALSEAHSAQQKWKLAEVLVAAICATLGSWRMASFAALAWGGAARADVLRWASAVKQAMLMCWVVALSLSDAAFEDASRAEARTRRLQVALGVAWGALSAGMACGSAPEPDASPAVTLGVSLLVGVSAGTGYALLRPQHGLWWRGGGAGAMPPPKPDE